MKKSMLSMLGIACLSLSVLSPAVANADVTETRSEKEFVEFLETNGVSEQTADKLLNKLRSGEMLDSAKGNVEPVSQSTRKEAGQSITKATYPDGSVTVVVADVPVELPDTGTVVPYGTIFNGCSTTSGSGWATYKGCNVQGDNGQAYLKFKVDYERYSGANAQILRTYDAKSGSSWGWSASPASRTGYQPKSSIGDKAYARYHTRIQSVYGGGSMDFYTSFYLDYRGNAQIVL